jgi:hypothetical protein
MNALLDIIFSATTLLCAYAAGIYLVYLITGRYNSTLKTLIWMHVFSFLLLFLSIAAPKFLGPEFQISMRYIPHIVIVVIILVQSFWLYLKEQPFSFQMTFAIVFFMNVFESLVSRAASMFLFRLSH